MEVSFLFSKKRGFFCLLPLVFNNMLFRILTSTSRSSKLTPYLGLKELGSSHSEVNRVRMWLNYIGELQEMSLIKIMGKGEGIDDWPHSLQPHVQSSHLFSSYSYLIFLLLLLLLLLLFLFLLLILLCNYSSL